MAVVRVTGLSGTGKSTLPNLLAQNGYRTVDTVLERVASRTRNPFGKTEEERNRIIADTREIEPLLREPATVEIDTGQPLNAVLDQLAALAMAPDLRSST